MNNTVTNNLIVDIWQGWGLQTDFNPNGDVFANNTVVNAGYGYNFPSSANYDGSGPTGGGMRFGQKYTRSDRGLGRYGEFVR